MGLGLAFVIGVLAIGVAIAIFVLGESRRQLKAIGAATLVVLLLAAVVFMVLHAFWAQTCENCSASAGETSTLATT